MSTSPGILVRKLEDGNVKGLLEAFLLPPGQGQTKDLNVSGRELYTPELCAAVAAIIKSTHWCSTVNLSECSLDLEGFKTICEAFSDNTHVKSADLSMNGIGDVGARSRVIVDLLLSNDHLEELDVRDTTPVGVEGCKMLLNALIRNTTLHKFNCVPIQGLKAQRLSTVDLGFEGIGVDEVLMLAHFSRGNQVVENLNLAENHICGRGSTKTVQITEAEAAERKKQKPKHTRQQKWLQTVGLRALCESFKRAPLTELNLHNCALQSDGMKVLSHFLTAKRNSALTALDLSSNELNHDDVDALAKSLENNPFLTMLNLSGNSIGDGVIMPGKSREHHLTISGALEYYQTEPKLKGVEAIADILLNGELLTHLDISNNDIYGEGYEIIGDALANNEYITSVNLADNYLSDEGAAVCAEVSARNLALTSLNLSNNRLCNEKIDGTLKLIKGLPFCNLAHLELKHNRMAVKSEDGIYGEYNPVIVHTLCKVLRGSRIEKVDLSANNLTVEDAELCMDAKYKDKIVISERYLMDDDERIYNDWMN